MCRALNSMKAEGSMAMSIFGQTAITKTLPCLYQQHFITFFKTEFTRVSTFTNVYVEKRN